MVERREFKRLPAETEVQIRVVPEGGLKHGTGKNISGGGILLTSPQRFDPGTILDIEVLTRTHQKFSRVFRPLVARVSVVRVEGDEAPYEIAAEFIDVEK